VFYKMDDVFKPASKVHARKTLAIQQQVAFSLMNR
jgi:hypothetical protein